MRREGGFLEEEEEEEDVCQVHAHTMGGAGSALSRTRGLGWAVRDFYHFPGRLIGVSFSNLIV